MWNWWFGQPWLTLGPHVKRRGGSLPRSPACMVSHAWWVTAAEGCLLPGCIDSLSEQERILIGAAVLSYMRDHSEINSFTKMQTNPSSKGRTGWIWPNSPVIRIGKVLRSSNISSGVTNCILSFLCLIDNLLTLKHIFSKFYGSLYSIHCEEWISIQSLLGSEPNVSICCRT